jgi:lipopolysaccharide/colanic/teichoic acid biosynthesis glycosyltransferase
MLKRLFDIAFSSLSILVLSPLFIVIALSIRVSSPGPIFYRGMRVGLYGKNFRMFKFRTMTVDADKIGGPSTADVDPRITGIGSFLRKYKLDELPQLINVLRGDMSFVGPRPEVQHYVNMFTEEEKAILSVSPGITDWATLWNTDEGGVLAGCTDPEQTYLEKIRPEKIRLQLEYVRRQSLWIDLTILSQTLVALIFRVKPQALNVVNEKR